MSVDERMTEGVKPRKAKVKPKGEGEASSCLYKLELQVQKKR